jgi:hypothetical protein
MSFHASIQQMPPRLRRKDRKISALPNLREAALHRDALQIRWHSRSHEILWNRSGEMQAFAGAQVSETEFPGMQHLAWETGTAAIDLIAKHWMPEVFEMNANLMRTARVQRAFDEGASGDFAQHAVIGARSPSAVVAEHSHFLAMNWMTPDRALDHAPDLPKFSRRESKINLRHFAPRELPRKRLMRGTFFATTRQPLVSLSSRCIPAAAHRHYRKVPGKCSSALTNVPRVCPAAG